MTIPNASKDAEQMKLSCIAGKNAKHNSHYANSLVVSHKVKHTLIIQPSNPPPRCLPNK